MAKSYLRELLDRTDNRKILNVIVFLQNKKVGPWDIESNDRPRGLYESEQPIDVPWLIKKEWRAEAGNMVISGESTRALIGHNLLNISVCGHAAFEQCVRAALRATINNNLMLNDIHLMVSDFKPEEI